MVYGSIPGVGLLADVFDRHSVVAEVVGDLFREFGLLGEVQLSVDTNAGEVLHPVELQGRSLQLLDQGVHGL